MTHSELIATWRTLLTEGKIRKMTGKPYTGFNTSSWWGNPPRREDCTPIEDFEWPTAPKKVVEHSAFGASTTKEIQAPIPQKNLRDRAHTHAVSSCGFEWAVSFRIMLDGQPQGTFYANEWGWEFA